MNKKISEPANSKRVVIAPNITNFRDLGGCPCEGGKFVIPGHFYRSGNLSQLKEEDISILKEKNIQMIVDLRSYAEVENEPDIVPDGCEYYHYSGIVTMDDSNSEMNEFAGNMDMKSVVIAMLEKKIQFPDPIEYLTKSYETMAVYSNAFREMFTRIKQNPEKPIVFHCTAGKDRTGIGAALILLILGSSEETVMEDYLLSNIYRKEVNDKLIAELSKVIQDDTFLKTIRVMLEVESDFLKAFFAKVHECYGTWDNYFETALCITKEEREFMKERYLV